MRHPVYETSADDAAALFRAATTVHLAGIAEDGAPVLRTVHPVVVDGWLAFHGAPKGEKTELAGGRVVISTEEIVASIPSYFIDPERACPATTYYRSAQLAGVLERLDQPELKAKVLEALMQKLQPEGGYVPIEAQHPLYKNAVRGILVMGVRLEGAVGKNKLGQNRKPEELAKVLDSLWRRGDPSDATAIDRVARANRARLASPPAFLAAPDGVWLRTALDDDEAPAAAALLEGQYWLNDMPLDRIARAHTGSSAWVGAEDAAGELIGTARALSDGARIGWIYDVAVAPDQRGKGVGKALVRLLLDHPAVRGAKKVMLGTRDAMTLYAQFGFEVSPSPLSTSGSNLMTLLR